MVCASGSKQLLATPCPFEATFAPLVRPGSPALAEDRRSTSPPLYRPHRRLALASPATRFGRRVRVKSPWKSMKPLEPDHEYVVLASSIPARRMSSTPRLFRGASAVRKQLQNTPGVVGFSLLARPLRKQYATLSVWVDEPALAAFAVGSPHRELMAELAPDMGTTKFLRWTIKGSVGQPSWSQALSRLAEENAGGETRP